MRRYLVVALAVLTLLGVLSPPAFAQAPAPKVTITGAVDQVSSLGQNIYDGNQTRTGDNEWYARMRFRPDITAEVGKAKVVLGLEIDTVYGQVSATDNNLAGQVAATNAQRAGTTSGFDLNTDTQGSIEVKWAYTEFALAGKDSLLPFIPVETVARLGAQPFATTYKGAVLASGDFAGVNLVSTWTPQIKSHLTYVQVEEDISNRGPMSSAATVVRGDDWAVIFSVDATPIKGLSVRPIYSYFEAPGATSGSARAAIGALTVPTNNVDEERRHTVGFDARWTWGNLSIDPTYFYQFGSREVRCAAPGNYMGASPRNCIVGIRRTAATANISAHFFDIRGGWRSGPLLLEAMIGFSSGNKARDNLNKEIRYYAPLSTDSGYYAGWANILALGTDYFNGAVNGLGAGISYFQYGRIQTGYKATYSWTPALDTYLYVSPTWTARAVDTDTVATTRAQACIGNGLGGVPCTYDGDSSYLGTEANLGLVWRFAPGLTFDLVGAYLFAGGAMDAAEVISYQTGASGRRISAEDGYTVASRVRFSF